MRIFIITSGASRICKPIFDNRFDVVGVLESMPRGWQSSSVKTLRNFLKEIYHTAFKRNMNLENLSFLNMIRRVKSETPIGL